MIEGREMGLKTGKALVLDPPLDDRWWTRARCADLDPDLFFPALSKNPNAYNPGKAICALCSVRRECLEEALVWETGESRTGLWGGLSPVERAKVVKTRSKQGFAHGTRSKYAQGCRCDLCRAASKMYEQRRRWKKVKALGGSHE